MSAKGFSKTQPAAELVSEVFRLKPGELENPMRVRKLNWDKFDEVIKGILRSQLRNGTLSMIRKTVNG